MNQTPNEQWAGVPIPLNVRPDSGVRVIVSTPAAPASIPDMPDLSDPAVAGARVTFFPGRTAPWVEIWVRRPAIDCDQEAPVSYAYYDIHRPPRDTQEEWLALLATGQSTTLTPCTTSETPQSVDRDGLIDRAKMQHDRECNCDPKYLMSCPRVAQAILSGGQP